MPDFVPHALDLASGRVEVEEVRALLRGHADLRVSLPAPFTGLTAQRS